MNPLETAALAYVALGVTCWLVLAVAYFRRGRRSSSTAGNTVAKSLFAAPVVVLWPLLLIALLRRETRLGRGGHP